MRVGKACAAWGLVSALALAGCSGGDEQAGGPRPSGPPADHPTSADTSGASDAAVPEIAPPTLPALAREHTNAGAKAFVRYYIDVLYYAWLESKPLALRRFTPKVCSVCTDSATVLKRRPRRGGTQTGGSFRIRNVAVTGSDRLGDYLLVANIKSLAGRSRAAESSPFTPIHKDAYMLVIHLGWGPAGWRLENLGIT